jgi:hypothetical protein
MLSLVSGLRTGPWTLIMAHSMQGLSPAGYGYCYSAVAEDVRDIIRINQSAFDAVLDDSTLTI